MIVRRRDHTNCLASTATASSTASLDSIFLQVGVIGMAGTRVEIHCTTAIILRSLILIANNHRNWRAEGISALGAGLNLYSVLFIAGCGESALAGTSPGHLRLDVGLREGHAWRAAIDDTAY